MTVGKAERGRIREEKGGEEVAWKSKAEGAR